MVPFILALCSMTQREGSKACHQDSCERQPPRGERRYRYWRGGLAGGRLPEGGARPGGYSRSTNPYSTLSLPRELGERVSAAERALEHDAECRVSSRGQLHRAFTAVLDRDRPFLRRGLDLNGQP